MANDDPVELDCVLIDESPKAYKIEIMVGNKTKTLWFPKSQCEVEGRKKGTKITLPYWLASKEGLV